MKLNYKRTICVGFAFFLICAFWQAYDTIIPKILTDRFGMSQTLSGVIMAADNVFALVLLPLFGIISDKCRSRLGRRTPFILVGTLLAVTAFISLSAVDAAQLSKLGLIDDKSYTCTCYMDEVGNVPKKGEVLSWAESSAVVYANSVLGARCNRNSGIIELFGSIVGRVPYFGLVTDEGRKATWIVEVKTTKKPEAQILGSAIGMKVMEDVPYIKGLDKWIGTKLDGDTKAYLKDFGAATVSMTPSLWLLLLFVGLVHTGVAYALYFDSMKDLKAQTLAIFSYIDPIVAIILSALLLKESMGLYGVIGAVLVLGSTFISELPEKERN